MLSIIDNNCDKIKFNGVNMQGRTQKACTQALAKMRADAKATASGEGKFSKRTAEDDSEVKQAKGKKSKAMKAKQEDEE